MGNAASKVHFVGGERQDVTVTIHPHVNELHHVAHGLPRSQLAPLDAAARDPDRYLIERFGIKGLRHGRPMTVRLPVHLDEGLDRYVSGSRVRTRTALVLALLDAYLKSAGLANGGELTVNP